MVTIRDIARATGVSTTTVSNVIHGRDNRVSAEVIQKINEAIAKLGYVPNMSARSLVSSKSKVIGFVNHVITGNNGAFMEDPFHSAAISTIESTLQLNGYYLMLRTVDTAQELLAFLQRWNVDGLFFTGIFKDKFYDTLSGLNIPVVLLDSYVKNPGFCNVGLEDFQGSYLATRHLIDNGHKKIGFASPGIKDGGVLQERFLGYKAALSESSIAFDKSLVFNYEMDLYSCREAAREISLHKSLTGLVVTADIMAAGIMAGLREEGLRVPEDISIVGFDDINIARMVSPTLTTIHQDMALKGRLAVDFMIQLLNGRKLDTTDISLPVRLVERESVIRRG
ncbi:LacI family DNA-binding transcriptional regulator [Butyrivibrio sp. MC2013]|uniref:LacI family DNA-binding transcriptional regulator n=1 Tax=Butyrivibrio sp. MC2013 TaxID=1280686 RepID=UPI000428303D|nr:LacI family DNA-binding transcriptional regulator [Butyrivibrio sp. MC2013]